MTLKVDQKGISELAKEIEEAQKVLLQQLANRGYKHLRNEVPVETGNLQQGVAPPEIHFPVATLTVSARSGRRGARSATVYGADGTKKKTITLRPSKAYNYAEVVARGNRDSRLSPKEARAFLIPVSSVPAGEGYIVAGGQKFIMRRSRKGRAANPYDERAAKKLEAEAVSIGNQVLAEFFN